MTVAAPFFSSDAAAAEDGVAALAGRRVRLLVAEPDLADGLPDHEAAAARRSVSAPLARLPVGGWQAPWLGVGDGDAALRPALLVLSGFLLRIATEGTGKPIAAELVGAGDLVSPTAEAAAFDDGLVAGWRALTPVSMAAVDAHVMACMARWPTIGHRLLGRSAHRAQRSLLGAAVRGLPSARERVLAALRHLAGEWGRVTPGGVVVELPMTHAVLAGLTGVRRPTVTQTLGALSGEGLVERPRPDMWVLHDPALTS